MSPLMETDLSPLPEVGILEQNTRTKLMLFRWLCPNMVDRCHLQCEQPFLLEAEAAGLHELPFRHDSCRPFLASWEVRRFWGR
jgi:hypothetical protein